MSEGMEDGNGAHAENGNGEAAKHPTLTSRWLREAVEKARSAFEREMERDRKALDARFEAFWKERSAR